MEKVTQMNIRIECKSKDLQSRITQEWDARWARQCVTCTKERGRKDYPISEGFVIDNGVEYYCNDHEPTWYSAEHDSSPDDTYWTQWDD